MRQVERFWAKVAANDDEFKRGRIRVVCPDLTGEPEKVLPMWIEPQLDWGWFMIPNVDEVVEIAVPMMSDGDQFYGQSAILDADIRWRGKREYHEGEGFGAKTSIPDEFVEEGHYPRRRGFATPAGHILFFDDTEGQEQIRLSLALSEGGGGEFAYIDFDKSGNILLSNAGTGVVFLGKGAAEAGAAAWVVRGDEWKAWAETHTHPTGTGPSGLPAQPIPAAVLSETTKVK